MIRTLLALAFLSLAVTSASDLDVRGAAVNPDDFRYARPIPRAPRGIVRLSLDADVLAHSFSLSDVRVLDAKNRQIPYIPEHPPEPVVVPLQVPAPRMEERRSVYRIALPYDTLPAQTQIAFTTSARVFSREIEVRRPDDESRGRASQTLANATWSSADPDHVAPPLALSALLTGMRSVELVVDEGDNAALPITAARLLIPGAAIRFFDPGTPLTLVYGNPRATAPRYDLELLAPRIFAAPATNLSLPPVRSTRPEHAAPAVKVFWVAVAVAALVLFAVLARLIAGRVASE